jgi:hypothetical protein
LRRAFAIAGLLAWTGHPAGAADATASPATYTVNLSLVWQVGQKYGYHSDGTVNNSFDLQAVDPTAANGERDLNRGQEKIAFKIEADGTVASIFSNGSLQKVELTVKSFTVSENDGPAVSVAGAGAKIEGYRDPSGKKVFTVDGAPPTDQVARILPSAVTLGRPQLTDNDTYGPPGPVAVGATWPINPAKTLASAAIEGVQARSATGEMSLARVRGAGDDAQLFVTGSFVLDGMPPPPPFTQGNGQMKVALKAILPAITGHGTITEESVIESAVTAEGNNGQTEMHLTGTGLGQGTEIFDLGSAPAAGK